MNRYEHSLNDVSINGYHLEVIVNLHPKIICSLPHTVLINWTNIKKGQSLGQVKWDQLGKKSPENRKVHLLNLLIDTEYVEKILNTVVDQFHVGNHAEQNLYKDLWHTSNGLFSRAAFIQAHSVSLQISYLQTQNWDATGQAHRPCKTLICWSCCPSLLVLAIKLLSILTTVSPIPLIRILIPIPRMLLKPSTSKVLSIAKRQLLLTIQAMPKMAGLLQHEERISSNLLQSIAFSR